MEDNNIFNFPSRAKCLSNLDVCQQIASYLNVAELCMMDTVSSVWSTPVLMAFSRIKCTDDYNYMCFKKRYDLLNDKKFVCRAARNRKQNPVGLFMFGGSFGSLYTNSCLIAESSSVLKGTMIDTPVMPPTRGSTGACVDSNGRVVSVGGWDDAMEAVLDLVSDINVAEGDIAWLARKPLPRGLCFCAATSTIQGDIIVVGGGNSPYRGAEVYKDCLISKYTADMNDDINTAHWSQDAIPAMHFNRCGHSAVTLLNDNILVVGGYSGGADYLQSTELLDLHGSGRWSILPSMSVPRSGLAAVLGLYGSVYVTGGSVDGTISHATTERYDPREGKRWHPLESMNKARGYTAGCIGSNDTFYVSGGCNELRFTGGIECYDFRMDTWTELVSASSNNSNIEETQFEEYFQRVSHQMMYIM